MSLEFNIQLCSGLFISPSKIVHSAEQKIYIYVVNM